MKIIPIRFGGLILRPGGQDIIGREGQAQSAFVILRADGLHDADAARIRPESADNGGVAAAAVMRNPFGNVAAIRQLGRFVRRAEINDGLVKRVVADAIIPSRLLACAAGEQGGDERQRE